MTFQLLHQRRRVVIEVVVEDRDEFGIRGRGLDVGREWTAAEDCNLGDGWME